ncbi:hypothetical protein HanPSC8_Chr10g0449271 [Helianthus annuus]|nr:hypothetical protein HanPSC8_Chr10g0449271 [Helianthus annuus]
MMSISLQLELRKCSWLTILLLCVLMAVMLPRPSLIQYVCLYYIKLCLILPLFLMCMYVYLYYIWISYKKIQGML